MGGTKNMSGYVDLHSHIVPGVDDGSDFNIESSTERLILYTCYPFGENNVARTQKAVYVCSKLSGPVIGGND